jgi:hypothetical protein
MSLMNDGVKRIAYGYTRVSTEEQTFGASLENQRLAIQKYANQNNIEIVGWYTDAGISRDMTSFFNDIGFILAKCGVTLRSTQEVIDESPTGRFMLTNWITILNQRPLKMICRYSRVMADGCRKHR